VADREDAAMDRMQPPCGDAMLHGAAAESEAKQLPQGDHAVLPIGELCNSPLPSLPFPTFSTH
jgi:hypothetical protein